MIDEDATQLLECEKRLLDALCKPQEQLPDVIHKILSWYGGSFSKWISVKDRLPDPNNWIVYAVLTNENKLHKHQIAYYSTSNKWHLESNQTTPIRVTHWIPLPETPK